MFSLQFRENINQYFKGSEPADVFFHVLIGIFTVVLGFVFLLVPDLKNKVLSALFKSLKVIPGVQGTINKEKEKVKKMIHDKFSIKDQPQHLIIPESALTQEEILKRMNQMKDNDEKHWKSGKVSGTVYEGQDGHTQFLNKVYSLFSLSNPLHPDVFPSVRKFEAEVVRMTADMMMGDSSVCGAITSGGTESILMAVKTYRDRANVQNPEMIVPITVHAAFDKAAAYFKVKIIHIPVDQKTFVVDPKLVEKAITKNTIMIAGSAPNYPYGTIDPIPELAEIARKRGIGFHTDACLGGFLLPWLKRSGNKNVTNFDFSIPGVTSMSVDTHKYGYTVKGTSVVLFKNEDLRHHMYFVQPNWPGGMYASPSMAGSRSGGVIACAYASLLAHGKQGYNDKSNAIYAAAQKIKNGIKNDMPLLTLLGDSHSSVVAFNSKNFDIYKVGDIMSKKGWNLNSLQNPNSLHVCVTFPMSKMADTFLSDLKEAVQFIHTNPNGVQDGLAAIYGMTASFPDRSVISEIGLAYLDAVLTP